MTEVMQAEFLRIYHNLTNIQRKHIMANIPFDLPSRMTAQPMPVPAFSPPPGAPWSQPRDPVQELALVKAAIEFQEFQEEQEKRLVVAKRIKQEHSLALATAGMLADIRSLVLEGARPHASRSLASHVGMLQGLANSYGVEIVLVGDRTTAMLVLK